MDNNRSRKTRLFNDPVHGHIKLNRICQLIVDTKEFQRLRYIKQLGVVHYVFPGATHTRFEHSLGSYHLAGMFARKLQESYPDNGNVNTSIKISNKDILCVEIAALCHDIGCAPYSKFFFERFLPKEKNRKPTRMMFKIIKDELRAKLQRSGETLSEDEKLNDEDYLFIEEMIDGYKVTGSTMWPYEGRTEEKAFLYEIVQNHRNGIDVCKWDYMARDCQNLGITNNFDAHRYMEFARIIEVDGERQICTRDKEIDNLYSMFFTRYNLHKFAYQHRVVSGIELMLADILKAVKKVKLIKEDDTTYRSIIECLDHMTAFTKLSDDFLFLIQNARAEGQYKAKLKQAVDLLERLNQRDIYRCIYQSRPMSKKDLTDKLKIPLSSSLKEIDKKVFKEIQDRNREEKILVQTIYLDFGMKDENPMSRLRVYEKSKQNEAFKMEQKETSRLLNGMNYNELLVRVYMTLSSEQIEEYRARSQQCENDIRDILK